MGRKNRPVKIRKKSLPDVTRIQPPKRMDIWYAHLRENTGTSVQEGSRPVLVISNDMANKNSDVVTVIPLTSQMKRIELPTHCIIHDRHPFIFCGADVQGCGPFIGRPVGGSQCR